MRIRTILVDAFDTNLATLAANLDAAVDAACAEIEAAGGAVHSISPLPMSVSQDVGGIGHETWRAEHGILVTIGFRPKTD